MAPGGLSVATFRTTTSGRAALEGASGIVADAEARLRTATAPFDFRDAAAMLLRLADASR